MRHRIAVSLDDPVITEIVLEVTTDACGLHVDSVAADAGICTVANVEEIDAPAGRMMTSQQAADRIGVSRPWLVRHLAPTQMVGNRRRFSPEDLAAFVAGLRPHA